MHNLFHLANSLETVRKDFGDQRCLVLFRFYCDESYDGCPPGKARILNYEPTTYVLAGFFADQTTWSSVESQWDAVNQAAHVPRFHAAHLNGKTHEYKDWTDDQKVGYSQQMLQIIAGPGKRMYAFTTGMLADKYRELISDSGRTNLGHPYLACFGALLSRIGKEMDDGKFAPEDKIEVGLDQNDFQSEAVGLFDELKANHQFPYRHRLATCTPASSEKALGLQAADLIAYETFKRLYASRDNPEAAMRKVFSLLVETIGYDGGNYFSESILRKLKPGIEAAVCRPGGLIIIPPPS